MIATRKLQPDLEIFNKSRVTHDILTFATFYRSEIVIRTSIIGNHCILQTIIFVQSEIQYLCDAEREELQSCSGSAQS